MHRMPGGENLAAVRIGEPRHAAQQRGLAGSARPAQRHELAGLRDERELFEHAARAVPLVEIADRDAAAGSLGHDSRARTDALTWSITVTMTRMISRIANTRGKSSRSIALLSSWPMPPAPTMPSTVEARTLNSQM